MALEDRTVVNAVGFDEEGNQALVDASGGRYILPVTAGIARGRSGGSMGIIGALATTAATSTIPIRETTYTEPSSGQQMRVVSANANDTSAGTGTRTLRLTYFNSSMNGPFTELITLNGTTPVNTSGTDYRFIERMESVTVGSTGSNVGIISLQAIGGGTTFGTIAATSGQTLWGHHYVAAGRFCYFRRLIIGAAGVTESIIIRVVKPLTANSFEQQVGGQFRTITSQPSQVYDLDDFVVAGPARITLYVRPDAATAGAVHTTLIYYEI